MTECERTVQLYKDHFLSDGYTGRSFVYGLGQQTEYILKEFPDTHIDGLLDGYVHEGIFEGKPIVDICSLAGSDLPTRIIIVARKASENIIWRRIRSFCIENGIKVYSLHGHEMGEGAYSFCQFSPELLRINGQDSLEQLGRCVIGPILCDFVSWIHEQSVASGVNRVVFLARDGYLISQIYNIMYDDIAGLYLLTSRTACILAGMQSYEDIDYAMKLPFSGEYNEMLKKRFGVSDEETGYNRYDLYDAILSKSAIFRKNYLMYLKEIGLDNSFETYRNAIVDLSSSGTCQLYLEQLLHQQMKGLYFERIQVGDTRRSQLDIEGYIKDYEYFSLEPIIKQPVPSLHHIESNGSPVFCEERMSKEEYEIVEQIQRGIMEYAHSRQYMRHEDVVDVMKYSIADYLDYLNVDIRNYDVFTNRVI